MSRPVTSFRLATLSVVLGLTLVPGVRAQVPGLTGTLVATNKKPSTATLASATRRPQTTH
ncbi:MAG: hypothetical protein ABIX28_23100 [Vicinamibacterales bacterium]